MREEEIPDEILIELAEALGTARPQPHPTGSAAIPTTPNKHETGRSTEYGFRRVDHPDAIIPQPDAILVRPVEHDRVNHNSEEVRNAELDLVPVDAPPIRPPTREESLAPFIEEKCGENSRDSLKIALIACALMAMVSWLFINESELCRVLDLPYSKRLAANRVADRIIIAESNGNATAENALSSASGAGQFLEATWLELIRANRPDLNVLPDAEVLGLRYDPDLSRQMVVRLAERNAAILAGKCLPVTPGTLYLSHFAGGAGAVAVLSAPKHADAAVTMAKADSTGRTTRKMIVTANPFLEKFTVADLKAWADRKMKRRPRKHDHGG